jgi:hypothetical protein
VVLLQSVLACAAADVCATGAMCGSLQGLLEACDETLLSVGAISLRSVCSIWLMP